MCETQLILAMRLYVALPNRAKATPGFRRLGTHTQAHCFTLINKRFSWAVLIVLRLPINNLIIENVI